MTKKLLLLVICLISLQNVTLSATKSTAECMNEGFKAGTYYYKTGIKIKQVPSGCNIPDTWQNRAFMGGVGCVLQYGLMKTPDYYEIEHRYRLEELHEASMKNKTVSVTPESQNTTNINYTNQNAQQSEQEWHNQQLQQQQKEQTQSTLIDTGVQVIRSLIGY